MVQGVRPAEDHPDQHKDDTRLVEGLVEAEIIVSKVLKLFQALLLIVIRIDDPVLGHIPQAFKRVEVHEENDKEAEQEEEEVKFPRTTASHAEARAQAIPVHFRVEDEAADKVAESD